MRNFELVRVYGIEGLDRVLYDGPAVWPEGRFEQREATRGTLSLYLTGVTTPDALTRGLQLLDQRAEEFRLAIEFQVNQPVQCSVQSTHEPDVYPPGVLRGGGSVSVTGKASLTFAPRPVPEQMPALPADTKRWVRTLSEMFRFDDLPDEAVKRAFLIIEELFPDHRPTAMPEQVARERDLSALRDFVSHPNCTSAKVVGFISSRLPSSQVPGTSKPTVNYDRTNPEHRQFVAGYVAVARTMARELVRARLA